MLLCAISDKSPVMNTNGHNFEALLLPCKSVLLAAFSAAERSSPTVGLTLHCFLNPFKCQYGNTNVKGHYGRLYCRPSGTLKTVAILLENRSHF